MSIFRRILVKCKKPLKCGAMLFAVFSLAVIAINLHVIDAALIHTSMYLKHRTVNIAFGEGYKEPASLDCALILGAGIRNNKPSPMLKDRLDCGIRLYKDKAVKKLLMSGDHGKRTTIIGPEDNYCHAPHPH